ncbi:uncharacterized protein [Ptychodera flava]|uniref:uncharacterized protein n=1 Tax=Ptychodera flava TaxID=63121 RepID=UPI00396A399E
MPSAVVTLKGMNARARNRTKAADFDGNDVNGFKRVTTFSEAHYRRRCRALDVNLMKHKSAIVLEYQLASMDLASEQKLMRMKLRKLQITKDNIERQRQLTRRKSLDLAQLEAPESERTFARELSEDSVVSKQKSSQSKSQPSKKSDDSNGRRKSCGSVDLSMISSRRSQFEDSARPRQRLPSEESANSVKSPSRPVKLPDIDLITRMKVQPAIRKWKAFKKKKEIISTTFITDNPGRESVRLSLERRNSLQNLGTTAGLSDGRQRGAPRDLAAVAPKPLYQRKNSLTAGKQGLSSWLGINENKLKTTRRRSVPCIDSDANAREKMDEKRISFAALVETVMAMKSSGVIQDV